MISFSCIVKLLLLLGISACSLAENYKLSRTAVVFGEANGVALSLVESLALRNFDIAFVFNGQQSFDTVAQISQHTSKVISCSDQVLSKCTALVDYAAEKKPLDLIIDLKSSNPVNLKAFYTLFQSNRKPRVYALLSTQALYAACHSKAEVKEYSEHHCVIADDQSLASGPTDVHPAEYELGRQMLETERELRHFLDSHGQSNIVVRAGSLFGARDSLESLISTPLVKASGGEKKSQMLTWLLLAGVSAHYNQSISAPHALRDAEWSVLYSRDLATLVGALDLLANVGESQVFSRTYNLASGRVTLQNWVTSLVKALGMRERPTLTFSGESDVLPRGVSLFYPDFYPPTRTKPLDCTLAARELRFQPTELAQAIEQTVLFYRDELAKFDPEALPSQADEPIRVAINTIVSTGLFESEQIDTLLMRLRKQAAGALPNPQLSDGDEDRSLPGSGQASDHTEL